MALTIYIDGGSRGNPGPAAAGVVVHDDQGRPILEAGYFLGPQTNNQAEYHALLLALEAAANWGDDEISVRSDSELLVQQLLGGYRVRSADLRPLFRRAQEALLRFGAWQMRHVERALNQRADRLVNRALDAEADVVEVEVGRVSPRRLSKPPSRPVSPRVVARVTEAPSGAACPCGCRLGDEYEFGAALPAGVCVHAAAALLDAVRTLQNAPAETSQPCAPIVVRCGHEGCGLLFTVERASG